MALLLVTALDLAADRIEDCAAHARAMLEPKQQRLPEALERPLIEAVAAWDAGRPDDCRAALANVVLTAEKLDYL